MQCAKYARPATATSPSGLFYTRFHYTIRLITNTHKDQPDVVDVPVAYRADSAPHRINYYPVDTYYRKQLYYPRKAIYPLDSVICLLSNWVLDLPRLPRRLMSCHFFDDSALSCWVDVSVLSLIYRGQNAVTVA